MIMEKLTNLFKKIPVYLYVLMLIIVIINFNLLKDLKQLPSPLYGGDYYGHLGSMYHIFYGGNILNSGQMLDTTPLVPWIYSLYVVILAKITGLDPVITNVLSSLPLIPITIAIMYFLVRKITNSKLLIVAAILLVVVQYPIFKYTNFVFVVIGPLVLLAWYLYLEKESNEYAILLAASIALGNLTNVQLFFSQYILMAVILIDRNYRSWKEGKLKNIDDFLATNKMIGIIFIISFLISLLYWYAPIFVYHGKTLNPIQIFSSTDISTIPLQIGYSLDIIKTMFYGITIPGIMVNLLAITGIFIVAKRKEEKEYRFFYLLFVAMIIIVFNHLILYNLLGLNLWTDRMYAMFFIPMFPIWLIIGCEEIGKKFENRKMLVFGITIIMVIWIYAGQFQGLLSNTWFETGKQPLMQPHQELKNWIINNTDINDVFLSNNEDSFMMNALTGRKVVAYRRTHASSYVDMNQRMLDSAVIFYGNNDENRVELLKRYHVKYLLWSVRWFDNEFIINNGSIVGLFDPLSVPTNSMYTAVLDNNEIEHFETHTYLDPAPPTNAPTYDLTIIIPKVKDISHPWDPSLDKYLKPVKTVVVNVDGQTIPYFIVYEVDY
ncbi:MAG: hypothetical protein Q7S22_08045 [Candidatus Micrarchaeota archaeon]|nr:hypothetical protein [Candidatus Micrarchaeota archaeon]